ncbi:MAG: arginine deiminase [Clostridia bacterium]
MRNNLNLKVESEIGTLEAVILHRPGKEMERLTPDTLKESLFEDIPWVKQMQIEHDGFAQVLEENDTKIYYVEDLLKEVLASNGSKEILLKKVIETAQLFNTTLEKFLFEYITNLDTEKIIEALIAGVTKSEVPEKNRIMTLTDYVKSDKRFFLNPIPNLYFMRDPAAVIGNSLSVSTMFSKARKREGILLQHIYEHHPLFENVPLIHHVNSQTSIEGGDILVLNENTIAIGCSTRTAAPSIEKFAEKAFETLEKLERVVVVELPKLRSFMHLDTVFTMVDYDKFTIYPGIEPLVKLYEITKGKNNLQYKVVTEKFSNYLESILKTKIKLIRSGGGNPITAAREQWNDSTNTLAIAPGVVVTYSRNEASNKVLRDYGIKVIEIADSELIRGRGGPRCMSMPIRRSSL